MASVAQHVQLLARERIDRAARRRLGTALLRLPTLLTGDELPLVIGDAYDEAGPAEELGLLAVTDQRLIFLSEGGELRHVWSFDEHEIRAQARTDPEFPDSIDITVTVDDDDEHVFEYLGGEEWSEEIVDAINADDDLDTEAQLSPTITSEAGRAGISQTEHNGPRFAPDGTATCPWCAELINPQARLCKHCGTRLDEQPSPPRQTGSTPVYRDLGDAAAYPTVGGWGWAIAFFGLLGAAIGYFSTRSDDPARANHIMKWGLIWTIPSVVVWQLVLWVLPLLILATHE
jgi:hypothetical protein